MYQNFTTDLIKHPNNAYTEKHCTVYQVVSAGEFVSGEFAQNTTQTGSVAFEIDPTKNSLFSFKCSITNASPTGTFGVYLYTSPTPLESGDLAFNSGIMCYVVPVHSSNNSPDSVNILLEDKILLEQQLTERDGNYYYAVLALGAPNEIGRAYFAGRVHYADKSVYQPSK